MKICRAASLLFILLSAVLVRADDDDGFLVFQHEVPKYIIRFDNLGRPVRCPLVRDDTYPFEGFSLGGSRDLPESEVARFKHLVATTSPERILVIQGRADDHRWGKPHTKKENDRLDLDLADARAKWAIALAKPRKIYRLDSILERDGRAFDVHVLLYAPLPAPAPGEGGVPTIRPQFPEKHQPFNEGKIPSSPLRIGGGGGVSLISAGGMYFALPIISLDFRKACTDISLLAGWRPVPRPESDVWGARAESLAGAEVTEWGCHLGFAAGLNGVWQTVRRNDEFTKRAFGFYLGPKLRFCSKNLNGQAGASFQVLNLNRLYRNAWWGVGYGLAVRLQYFIK